MFQLNFSSYILALSVSRLSKVLKSSNDSRQLGYITQIVQMNGTV